MDWSSGSSLPSHAVVSLSRPPLRRNAIPVVCWPFTPPARERLTSEGSNYRVSSGAARKDTGCATVSLCPRATGCEALGHGFTMLHCRCYWDNSYGHSRNGKSRYFHSQGQHYRLVALMPANRWKYCATLPPRQLVILRLHPDKCLAQHPLGSCLRVSYSRSRRPGSGLAFS